MDRSIVGHMLHEGGCRMRRDPRDLHAPCGQFYHEQDIERHASMPRGDFHGEEVDRREDLPVEPQALRPTHVSLLSLWRRIDVMTTQDVPLFQPAIMAMKTCRIMRFLGLNAVT
jgi:hypothetical protein